MRLLRNTSPNELHKNLGVQVGKCTLDPERRNYLAFSKTVNLAFSNHDLRIRYENAYEKWLAENEDMYGYEVPEDLESLLDGSYWETK